MKLSPPKKTTFWAAVILALLGLIGAVANVPVLKDLAFWLVLVGFVILALGNLLDGF